MAFKSGASNLFVAVILATLLGFPFVFLRYEASSGQIQSTFSKLNTMLGAGKDPEFILNNSKELEDMLAQASMAKKTVIITTLNEAWSANNTMIDLYLQSFHLGKSIKNLLDHMIIVTLDQTAHDRCLQLHPHCYRLRTSGVDFRGEKKFMSEDYMKMMWRRIELVEILELGYSFLFSDADIVWFRNPFARFFNNTDIQIACDRYYGKPFNVTRNAPNGGFVYTRRNRRTIAMYKYWYEARLQHPRKHDQDVLNIIVQERDFGRIGVQIRFLDTVYFSGFCQKSRDMTKVVTMHANCCKGLNNKIKDLRLTLDDWNLHNNSGYLNKTSTSDHLGLWRAPRACVSPRRTNLKVTTST